MISEAAPAPHLRGPDVRPHRRIRVGGDCRLPSGVFLCCSAAVTGHATMEMARHYTRQHDRRERAKALLGLHKIISDEQNQ